ncbi:MAG: DNA cytosine methyltransferase [Defluviitaleaceae bacterium]|nr:DNA cytosine methyltransferase [Defluviitaleaceae bacterium]
MSKIKVVSLFSGGGGLDLGFISTGFDVVWAIDNEKNAAATYARNIGQHIVCLDINDLDTTIIPHCDIVIGGPPCQSFSLAGNRKTDDLRGKLVWKYLEIIETLKPKAFLFENVIGLLSAKNCDGDKIFSIIKKDFEDLGYTVSAEVVDASNFGIPQRRKRVIIVGSIYKAPFVFPSPTHGELSANKTPFVNVFDALDDLPSAVVDTNAFVAYTKPAATEYQRMMRVENKGVTEHFIPTMSELDKYIISHVRPGGNYMDVPLDVPSERIRRLQKSGGHTTCYGRMREDAPSYTINTYFNRPNVGCNIHYSENRLITVREALRLQSFPDSFVIVSSSKQGRNLIVGNAVPPKLAAVLANEVKQQFF